VSTRTGLRPQQVIPSPQGSPANGNAMATNITSAPTILQSLSMCSYSLSWAGSSPVGTVSVEASNDYSLLPNGLVNNAGTWNVMTLNYGGSAVTTIPISGNTGSGLIDITDTACYAIRLIYTATSGTGALTVLINCKVQ
jgi:hypothetical protein